MASKKTEDKLVSSNDSNNNMQQVGFYINGTNEENAEFLKILLLNKAASSTSAWVKWIHLACLHNFLGLSVPYLSSESLEALQSNDMDYIENFSKMSLSSKVSKAEKKDVGIQCTTAIMGLSESKVTQTSFRRSKNQRHKETQTEEGKDKELFCIDSSTQTTDDNYYPRTRNNSTQTLLVHRENKKVQVDFSCSEDSPDDTIYQLVPIDGLKDKAGYRRRKLSGDESDSFHGRPLIKKGSKFKGSPPDIPLESSDLSGLVDPRLYKETEAMLQELNLSEIEKFLG